MTHHIVKVTEYNWAKGTLNKVPTFVNIDKVIWMKRGPFEPVQLHDGFPVPNPPIICTVIMVEGYTLKVKETPATILRRVGP